MLVLSRKKNESIVINNDIIVTVVEIRGDKVRLGIVAPKEVPVHRQEVYEAIHGKDARRARPRPRRRHQQARPTAPSERPCFGTAGSAAACAAGSSRRGVTASLRPLFSIPYFFIFAISVSRWMPSSFAACVMVPSVCASAWRIAHSSSSSRFRLGASGTGTRRRPSAGAGRPPRSTPRLAHGHGVLQHRAQLPHVARPGVLLQPLQRRRRQP